MLNVNEITQLSIFKDMKLICGERGLGNPVEYAAILEYESVKTSYEGYSPGDFVLASLFFTKDAADFVFSTMRTIIKRRVAAIAMKNVFGEEIPDDVLQLAVEYNVPIFTFTNAYMEDLVIGINESLRTKSQHLIYEQKLHSIIDVAPDSNTVKSIAKEINAAFHANIITAYITPKDEISSVTIHSYFKRLIYKQSRERNANSCSIVKYNAGMLLIYSFTDNNFPKPESLYSIISTLLINIDLDPDSFYIGVCDTPHKLSALDVSVRHAIYTNYLCAHTKKHITSYTSIGVYKYLLPMVFDPLVRQNTDAQISLLKEYDLSFSSNILDTMVVYIQNNGDIAKTAKEIFQHPNTVRYRIKKAYSILSLDEPDGYESLYLLITVYTLSMSDSERQ
ncbi:MAG: PucR family transcriptional regulator [Oscillospiraceae bacterium]|jgi:sugar diacid utilization regulator|nr:PucR family transcriptional regulator [Oscillospiraceae bacterium]